MSQISVSFDDEDAVITASGHLDLTNTEELQSSLAKASESAETVTVDLRSASFIDTAVLDYLATAGKKMLGRKKRLKVLVDEKSQPRRVLLIVGFPKVMDVVEESITR